MWYYVVNKDGKHEVVASSKLGYFEAKQKWGDNLAGRWGREDYAVHWRDFYNNEIDRDELVKRLDRSMKYKV